MVLQEGGFDRTDRYNILDIFFFFDFSLLPFGFWISLPPLQIDPPLYTVCDLSLGDPSGFFTSFYLTIHSHGQGLFPFFFPLFSLLSIDFLNFSTSSQWMMSLRLYNGVESSREEGIWWPDWPDAGSLQRERQGSPFSQYPILGFQFHLKRHLILFPHLLNQK